MENNVPQTPKTKPEDGVEPLQHNAGGVATAIGNAAHNNRNFFTSNPVGNASYHLIRSAVASIPYGIGAAAVWTTKNAVIRDMTARGLGESTTARVLKSPLMAAAQIAASFTFYRTGSFTMRRMYERVFDENNTREDTIKQVADTPKNFVSDFGYNLGVQAHSVPWAALSLGYIAQMGVDASKDEGVLEAARDKPTEIVTHKNARKTLLNQMGRNTIAYSVFFEAADALAKHYRLQRGIADPTLPLSEHRNEQGETVFKIDDPDNKYGFFTNDTGAGRLMFRRLVPAAVGISAYTAAKRLGYRYSLTGKQAETLFEKDKGAAAFGLDAEGGFWSTAWREGAATSLFAAYTFVKDPWEKAYDNFFDKLEKHAKKDDVKDDNALDPKNKVQQKDSEIEGTIKDAPLVHASLS